MLVLLGCVVAFVVVSWIRWLIIIVLLQHTAGRKLCWYLYKPLSCCISGVVYGNGMPCSCFIIFKTTVLLMFATIPCHVLITPHGFQSCHDLHPKKPKLQLQLPLCGWVRLGTNMQAMLKGTCHKLRRSVDWQGVLYMRESFHPAGSAEACHIGSPSNHSSPPGACGCLFPAPGINSNRVLEGCGSLHRC